VSELILLGYACARSYFSSAPITTRRCERPIRNSSNFTMTPSSWPIEEVDGEE